MRVARVFPSRTRATPDDELVFTGPPGLFPPEVDEVHVSVTFSWDLPYAEMLAREWGGVAPVRIGGPATGMRGEEFTPGKYLRSGYVITSRGCPNRCWFCSVWKRDGTIRELPITVGTNVLDDNLLACSAGHIQSVFSMLRDAGEPVEFTGGFEAVRFERWHAEELGKLKLKQVFFAYDTPDDLEPLHAAGKLLREHSGATFENRKARCYVLIGYPRDTIEQAEVRLKQAVAAGFMPMAMLYRDARPRVRTKWNEFQRSWARPALIARNAA